MQSKMQIKKIIWTGIAVIISFLGYNCASYIDTIDKTMGGYEVGNIAEYFSKDFHLIEFYFANVNGDGPRYYVLSQIEDSINKYENNCHFTRIEKGQILDISPKQFEENPKPNPILNINSGSDVVVIWNNEYIIINDTFSVRVYYSENIKDLYVRKDKIKGSFCIEEW
jgi:hypothetical protein